MAKYGVSVAFTGHRPNKLWGYHITEHRYIKLHDLIVKYLVELKARRMYCGMALGADTIAAMACLEAKRIGRKIDLIACIPFEGQDQKWPDLERRRYHDLLSKSDEVVVCSEGAYEAYKMYVRNQYMVDRADIILAAWDGSKGGTGSCINYAEGIGRKIINLLDEM